MAALATLGFLSNGGLHPVHICRTMMVGGASRPRCLCAENLEDSRKLLFCKRDLHQMGRCRMRHSNVGQGERTGNNEPFYCSSLYKHMKFLEIKKIKRPFPSPFKISFDKNLRKNIHCSEDFLSQEMYSHLAIVGKHKIQNVPSSWILTYVYLFITTGGTYALSPK